MSITCQQGSSNLSGDGAGTGNPGRGVSQTAAENATERQPSASGDGSLLVTIGMSTNKYP